MIRVTGKGNRTRLVPVGSKAREAIRYYLEIERPKLVSKRRGAEIGDRLKGQRAPGRPPASPGAGPPGPPRAPR